MVEGGKAPAEGGEDRYLLGGVAGHDLGVLLERGRPGHLGRERADVVGHEPVHGRLLGGHRPGALYGAVIFSATDAAVARRIDEPEQLRIDVLVLLAGIGTRAVHVRCQPVGHDLVVGRAVPPTPAPGY